MVLTKTPWSLQPLFFREVASWWSIILGVKSVCRITSPKSDPSMRLYSLSLHLRFCFTHIKVLLESVGPLKFRGKEFMRSKAQLRQSYSQRPGFLRRKQCPPLICHASERILRPSPGFCVYSQSCVFLTIPICARKSHDQGDTHAPPELLLTAIEWSIRVLVPKTERNREPPSLHPCLLLLLQKLPLVMVLWWQWMNFKWNTR